MVDVDLNTTAARPKIHIFSPNIVLHKYARIGEFIVSNSQPTKGPEAKFCSPSLNIFQIVFYLLQY